MSDLVEKKEGVEEFLGRIVLKEDIKKTFELVTLKSIYQNAVTLGIPQVDFIKFVHKCQRVGADPTLDQAYLLPYKDYKTGVISGQIMFHYSFLEAIANQQGDYGGFKRETKVDNYFNPTTLKETKMLRCDVTIIRGQKEFSFTAWFDEYAKRKSSGELTGTWKSAPYMMLEKCALAGALRRAYPEAMSGIYSIEESGFLENAKNQDIIEAEQLIQKRIEQKERYEEQKKEIEAKLSGEKDLILKNITSSLAEICEGMNSQEKLALLKEKTSASNYKELEGFSIERLREVEQSLKKPKIKDVKEATFTIE